MIILLSHRKVIIIILAIYLTEELLNEGVCDIIAFGRPLLADPEIVNKLEIPGLFSGSYLIPLSKKDWFPSNC